MHEMICPSCGTIAQVTPDADRCPGCSQSLKRALPHEAAARYFYERAAAIAPTKGSQAALAEVQRGLAYANTSDLLLLGAILSEQQGAYDLMRRYVAEIPLEDSLRDEAEWLLRSHQIRQRALRQGQATHALTTLAEERANGPVDLQVSTHREARGTPLFPMNSQPTRSHQRVWPTAIALIMLLAVLWSGWRLLNPVLDSAVIPPLTATGDDAAGDAAAVTDGSTQPQAVNGNAVLAPASAPQTGTIDAPISSSGEPLIEIDAASADSSAVEAAAPDNASVVDSPSTVEQGQDAVGADGGTASGADDDSVTAGEVPATEPTNTPEPIVDSTPAGALLDQNLQPFDILAYFKAAGRPDLAQLAVDAQIRDGELIIYGVVPWAEHRREILDVTQNVPGVTRVNSVDLRVRVPATYTVQEGDTLWIIAYRLYDDPARWPEIVSYNQALIPNPQSLRLGSTIQAPPAR